MPVTYHTLSALDRASNIHFRAALASYPPMAMAPDARPFFDTFMQTVPRAVDVSFHEVSENGVKGIWCRPAKVRNEGAILYFHGGGYVLGSAFAYRHVASQLAARTETPVFVVDYPLAPEEPFPAAADNALSAYEYLRARHKAIALAGDSAGGGLALSLLSTLASLHSPLPAAAAVMSPWTDLTLTNGSYDTRRDRDPLLSRASLETAAAAYATGHDRAAPRLSPLHGVSKGLPPVLVHVGDDEVLLDDTVRYVEAMDLCGNVAQGHIWEAMTHVFPTNFLMFEAAEAAMGSICEFLDRHLCGVLDQTSAT